MKNIFKHSLLIFLIIFTSSLIFSCTETTECNVHMDDDENGICDVCGKKISTICDIHMDDNEDGICDICGNKINEEITLSGYYMLTSKIVSNTELANTYLLNYLYFNGNVVINYIVDYSGVSTQNGTYTVSNDIVTIKYGIYEYNYKQDENTNTLSFDGMISKKKVKMTYALDESYNVTSATGDVSFTDELFGEDINQNFYNYCPTLMLEGNNIMHIWYCANQTSGNVTDYIYYRKGILTEDGKWTYSERQLVLSPTDNSWDSRHVCDPSVVKGDFTYDGNHYSYLMAYLGCATSNVTVNEVGLAVAKSPEGPYIKVGTTAFCSYKDSSEYGTDGSSYWGYGQPSVISVDKAGTILLFYTKGIKLGTYTFVEEWNLTNLNEPLLINSTKLADGGAIEVFNNADFAYDPIENRIYCIKEDHINGSYPTDGGVTWISGSNSLFYISVTDTEDNYASSLFKTHTWAKLGTISQTETGFARNHNSGILTDEYGWIINYEKIPVVYTAAELATSYPSWNGSGQWPSLHTYRLHGFVFEN